ncbi:RNA 2',3'-cyclic phosphodiesterase [Variovorax sp. J22P240]|uniref:RNA 2',3'-cyclic phosphodiesterase n=1 Tax=Variovorax sp. J22P240 TaxID=3053514 RepID=UPI002578F6D8|nr:RNA 2',3'-cyclic phosphodiesterase [Variovorax sp. J22P240]MDM0001341.1 RNA 2',3'-cyclic phosphodiesterase [Variovorax sp. J22P240]
MTSAPAPTRRLFIGLFPDPGVQAAIDAHRRNWWWPPGARMIPPARVHMTLHFLGEVPTTQQAALQDGLAEVPMQALTLVLRTPEVWRNPVAVLRPDEHEVLRALHERLKQPLQQAGLSPERAHWLPHLTIARKCLGAVPPDEPPLIPWQVSEFVLVCSHLTPPVHYEILARHSTRRQR